MNRNNFQEIHIDMDNFSVYTQDLGQFFTVPQFNVYEEALTNVLNLLDEAGLKAVFFINSVDLINSPLISEIGIRKILDRGHQLGNHSHSHLSTFIDSGLSLKLQELSKCHFMIKESFKYEMQKYRNPGFSYDSLLHTEMQNLGYTHDYSYMPEKYLRLLDLYFKYKGYEKNFHSSTLPTKCSSSSIESKHMYKKAAPIIPHYSTTYFSILKYFLNKDFFLERSVNKLNYFLFHGVDFVPIEDGSSPIPALKWKYSDRLLYFKRILNLIK